MRRILLITLAAMLVLAFAFAATACTAEEPATSTDTESQDSGNDSGESSEEPADAESDPDRALVENKCSLCHTTERVWAADYDAAKWETTIDRMKANGLVITDEEYDQIVEYLAGL